MPPCVPATGPHVLNMRACCRYTRRRPERTHGGVLNLHTGGGGGLCLLSFSLFLSLSLFSLLSSLLSFVPSSYLLFPLFFSRFSLLSFFFFFFSFSFSFFSSFSFSFSFFFSFFFFSCSCSFSVSFSSFFLLPFYSLFSSLPFTATNTVQSTDQQTRRPTLRRLNVMWHTVRS